MKHKERLLWQDAATALDVAYESFVEARNHIEEIGGKEHITENMKPVEGRIAGMRNFCEDYVRFETQGER